MKAVGAMVLIGLLALAGLHWAIGLAILAGTGWLLLRS